MYGNAMDEHLTKKSGKELLQKAIEQWKRDGLWDRVEGKRGSLGEETGILDNMEKDPVINLFMTALSYQTNLLKELVSGLKTDLVDEFVRRTVPYHLTRPVPALTVLQAKTAAEDVASCMIDDSDVIVLEKRNKSKLRFKELEKFHFLPLFKTRILNARIMSFQRTDTNTLSLTLSAKHTLGDLSGLSFFFPRVKPDTLSVSVDGVELPVCSLREFDRMPLCSVFDTSHCVYNRSLLYGTPESWSDSVSSLANSIFYIGESDFVSNSHEVTLQLKLGMHKETFLEQGDVLINCVPIVNVEKCNTSLSKGEPIKRLSSEKAPVPNSASVKIAERNKSFLNLLAPTENEYDWKQISIRRFGAERYHAGKLVAQTHALVHRYSSDFHAFREFADTAFDEKMNALRVLLNEIDHIVSKNQMPHSGVYVMLTKNSQNLFNTQSRIEVSYLLTDGSRANDIVPGGSIAMPPSFDAKESTILMTTYGGKDEVVETGELNAISMYYNHSRDRLITRADIKGFCFKDLVLNYHIPKELISGIALQSSVNDNGYEMEVMIKINSQPEHDLSNSFIENVASELQQKIQIRATDFVSYKVSIVVE